MYGLTALAMLVTLLGVVAGATFALPIVASGFVFVLLLAEVILIFSARIWSKSSPLNIILFFVFPFISGLTITPFLMGVLAGYVNGAAILLNAALATTLLASAAAILARMITPNSSFMIGRMVFHAAIGLFIFGILQLFFPALRGSGFEMLISGVGIVTFGFFLAYDVERLRRDMSLGESPFLLALSLYLDIFNLFLYVVRFMLATSGRRR